MYVCVCFFILYIFCCINLLKVLYFFTFKCKLAKDDLLNRHEISQNFLQIYLDFFYYYFIGSLNTSPKETNLSNCLTKSSF